MINDCIRHLGLSSVDFSQGVHDLVLVYCDLINEHYTSSRSILRIILNRWRWFMNPFPPPLSPNSINMYRPIVLSLVFISRMWPRVSSPPRQSRRNDFCRPSMTLTEAFRDADICHEWPGQLRRDANVKAAPPTRIVQRPILSLIAFRIWIASRYLYCRRGKEESRRRKHSSDILKIIELVLIRRNRKQSNRDRNFRIKVYVKL